MMTSPQVSKSRSGTNLLHVLLEAAGQRRVHHRADAGRVEAHPERHCRHHHAHGAAAERRLDAVALLRAPGTGRLQVKAYCHAAQQENQSPWQHPDACLA